MLLHDRATNRHRVVAMADDGAVLLDCPLFAGMAHELRKAFLQWKDGERIWGVKFVDTSA